MNPKFRDGQRVRLRRGSAYRGVSESSYKIIRLLPEEGDECRYRIKGGHEQHERVVRESELSVDP
jgi:hypothetical protein